jgi:hypothetical protein
MTYDRVRAQRLEHLKGFRVLTGTGPPKPSEGHDGELTLRSTKSGLKLFCKYGNRWYSISDQSLREISGNDLDSADSSNISSSTFNSRTGDLLMGGIINMSGAGTRGGLRGYDTKAGAALSSPINGSGLSGQGLRFQGTTDNVYIDNVHMHLEASKRIYFDGVAASTYMSGASTTLSTLVGGATKLEIDTSTTPDLMRLTNADLYLKGNTNSATGNSELIFLTQRNVAGDAAGQDGDDLGKIAFKGYNDAGTPELIEYASIFTEITDASDGTEAGKLTFSVLTKDAGGTGSGVETGLILIGSNTNDEVSATISKGTASVTTIAGDMAISGDTITSAGALEIDPGGRLSITGQHVNIDATQKLYLDGGTDTYIYEHGADNVRFVVGDEVILMLTENGGGASDSVAITAATPLYLDGGSNTYIHEVSADKLEIVVGADEMLTLDEANQRVTIEADKISYKTVGGTVKEYSVADSAYAGMILGYTTVGIDAADDSYTLTATMESVDDALKVKFVAPPSGVVEIMAQIYFDAARRVPVLGLSDQSRTAGYQAISFPNATDVTNEHLQAFPPSLGGDSILRPHWVVTGLTAGTAYEWWIGAKTSLGTGGVLKWGGNVTNEYPPFIMKATALPAAVTDYAVYG